MSISTATATTHRAIAATATAYRLYSPIAIDTYYAAAPIVRDGYNAAQTWIKEQAPTIEQAIKRAVLKSFIAILQFALAAIERAQDELEQVPVYVLQIKLAVNKAKQYRVRQEIKFWSFVSYHGLGSKAESLAASVKSVWVRKAELTRKVMDKVLCLN